MSDTSPRGPSSAPQLLADALLRSLTGTTVQLRVTNTNADTSQSEIGMVGTAFAEVSVGPAVIRKLRPGWQQKGRPQWELLLSASGVEAQVNALDLSSAASLFDLTLGVTISGQGYLIESFTSNEAFGQIYLYRLLLRETQLTSV